MSDPHLQLVQVSRIPGTAVIPTAGHPPIAPPHRPLSNTRIVLALIIAIVSDAASVVTEFVPPVQLVVDGVTALLLFLLLGRRWQILPGLIAEAVPGLAMLPFWIIVVLTIAVGDRALTARSAPER